MRVAVTGASGFVGRHVLAALARREPQVIAAVRKPEGASQVALDLDDLPTDPFGALGRPDVLVHLAWGGLPNYRAAHHVEHELPRQRAFLDACLDAGLQRLVISGTCLEYGLREGRLEESTPAAPVTAYAQAKDALRRHLEARRTTKPFELAWLRLFYVYGEGQAPTSLYSQLRRAVARGDAAFPMSPGDQRRDFLPIELAADIIARLALGRDDAGLINVCSGEDVSVKDQVRRWLDDWQASIALQTGVYAYPDYEPRAFWGDRRKLDASLGTT